MTKHLIAMTDSGATCGNDARPDQITAHPSEVDCWECKAIADIPEYQRVTSTESLERGDKILVATDGFVHEMTVNITYDDQSLARRNSRTALAHIRPGGYSVTLRNDNLAKYDVKKVVGHA